MTVRPLKQSSVFLDKFIKSQLNLSKPSPKLWHYKQIDDQYIDDKGWPILNLNHPILRRLESCRNIRQFNEVQSQSMFLGLFQHPLIASRLLKKLCTSLNSVSLAVSLYDNLEEPDSFMCNTIMRSFVNSDDPFGALSFYYEKMMAKWVSPNHYTFPLLVKVCAQIGSLAEGQKAHAWIMKLGFEFDLFVRNSLMHFYPVFGKIEDASMLFEEAYVLDLVSWNTMIDGYVKNGDLKSACKIFDEMPQRDVFTWNSMLSGYVEIADMEFAKELFDKVPCRDVVSWNCIIDGYARIGNVLVARQYFDWMPLRNVTSWNTMLALYVRCKDYLTCLKLFDKMIEGDARPNEASFLSVLTACSKLGRLDIGEWVHSYIKCNQIELDLLLSTALLTMYAKCGSMELARDIFDQMPERSTISWNSMIMGYGIHGNGGKALETFTKMVKGGHFPNDATFVCVLTACTHAGMVLEGWWYFNIMQRVYKIEPKVEHYGCMVDLLAKAGLMKNSEEFISKMPMDAGPVPWGALLSACSTHSNSELGEIVAKRLIDLEPNDSGPYVMLSNIYAANGKWDDVENVRKIMKEKELQKEAGSSMVQLRELRSESSKSDDSLHKRNMMYSMLGEIGAWMKSSSSELDTFKSFS
ncbi:pentatricopeptide repeat-containing protein [Tripterygium wilfordii]|uniref:Pentatricopeptide repeat-containing protein n=1 Tax=Tripterygium wilfordii TaxID=458696 RepID=A0A7J7CJT5_TRIWF|nr:pentatricopeptide repeat-containing protein At3g29230-like [Tripterygium wilfordii]KAF5734266.1 pentatricopeptide repeat-containing protein [Tripterygium wilfordii]